MLPICHNTTVRVYGAWIRLYYVLCIKTYDTFGDLFWSLAGSQQADRSARICETCLLYLHNHLVPSPHIERKRYRSRYLGKLLLMYVSTEAY